MVAMSLQSRQSLSPPRRLRMGFVVDDRKVRIERDHQASRVGLIMEVL